MERASVLPRCVAELSASSADPRANDTAICISPENSADGAPEPDQTYACWSELANRLEAYRLRRRKVSPNAAQTELALAEPVVDKRATAALTRTATIPGAQLSTPAIPEPQSISSGSSSESGVDDFAFTIAIGRIASKPHTADGRMMIDVSNSSDV